MQVRESTVALKYEADVLNKGITGATKSYNILPLCFEKKNNIYSIYCKGQRTEVKALRHNPDIIDRNRNFIIGDASHTDTEIDANDIYYKRSRILYCRNLEVTRKYFRIEFQTLLFL